MNASNFSKTAILLLSCVLSFSTFQAASEDIDLFSVDPDDNVNNPNVLIILDNSANWSRASQKWPEGEEQGQSEVSAIKLVINELDDSINVGLMEYVTGGNSADNESGFVRFDIRPMNTTHKAALSQRLDTIYENINDPIEKRSSGNPFGTLFWDAYNYLAGANHSNAGTGTPNTADPEGYTTLYSQFQSPLTENDSCTRTIIIFIGNNVQAGPTGDGATNVNALTNLGGSTAQIPFADYSVINTPTKTRIRTSGACYASTAACTTAENAIDADNNGISDCEDGGFTSCACVATNPLNGSPDATACPLRHFSVVGSDTQGTTVTVSDETNLEEDVDTGTATGCIKPAPAAGTTQTCPASTTNSTTAGNQTTTTQVSWANCFNPGGAGDETGCTGNRARHPIFGDKTTHEVVTETTTVTSQTNLGQTAACFEDIGVCSTAGFADCSNPAVYNDGCACVLGPPPAGALPPDATGCGAGANSKFGYWGDSVSSVATPTGTFSTPPTKGGLNFMSDEWSRFLRQTGVPIPGLPGVNAQVTTYTVDVFNAQQDADFSSLLFNIARVGGGKYYQAKNKDQIISALREIFDEIQAVNSAFASASLPVSATNRAQNENQVFIGLFRPDREKGPLWFGNLKRYQLARFGAEVDLADSQDPPLRAINNQTGFIADCAVSYWSTASSDFWFDVTRDNPDAVSACSSINAADRWSDVPDGPFVEKGAVADALRKRSTPRNIESLSSGTLVPFNSTNFPALNADTVNFIRGADFHDEDIDGNVTEIRATVHGDVVHSRPLPVNYGGTDAEIAAGTKHGVVVYYGANDGTFRAVKAATGEELWAFVAPEHFGRMDRLRTAYTPAAINIRYFGDTDPTRLPKDYFFDGSSSVFQTAADDKFRVFTTLRRGGRKIYAFDVDDPVDPVYLWSKGCPNPGATEATTPACDAGFGAIGQTWSIPVAAFVKGYSSLTDAAGDPNPNATPVLIVGGGYDPCEDDNHYIPTGCSQGSGVYILDAETGALLQHIDFGGRSVAADAALVDVDLDKMVDYAYLADTGGNVYRVDFINPDGSVKTSGNWTASRVAYTNGAGRKFLFAPALLRISRSTVFVALASGDREHPLRTQYPFDDKNADGTSDGGVLNRFYVFKDDLTDVNPATVLNLDDTAPVTGMLDNSNGNTAVLPTTADAATCASATPPLSQCKKGWFINLNEQGQGEQGVTSAIIIGGFVLFSTNRPKPPTTIACTTELGEARGYFLNLFTGEGAIGVEGSSGGDRSSIFTGGGLPPSPVIATVPIDGQIETVIIGGAKKNPGGGGSPIGGSSSIGGQLFHALIDSKRTPLYWFKTGDTD